MAEEQQEPKKERKKRIPKKDKTEVTDYKKPSRPVTNHLVGWIRQNDIIKQLLDGKDGGEIALYVSEKYNVEKSAAHVYISQARDEIKKYHERTVDYVVSLHIERYEYLYHKLYELGAHTLAMNALNQKEKLMGMHNKDFSLKVTNTEITSTSQAMGSTYDRKKLNEAEQTQLQLLLNKASV